MSTDAEIRSRLTSVFREVFDDDSIEIFDGMTAKDVAEWDSINHINLILAVEKDFGVKFTTRGVSNVANVGELIQLIHGKLS
jgi:acyl carrier protein